YGWPGNIRELKNVVERLTLLSSGPAFDADELHTHLPFHGGGDSGRLENSRKPGLSTLVEAERQIIQRTMQSSGGNKALAARSLGISKPTLYRKLRQYNLLSFS